MTAPPSAGARPLLTACLVSLILLGSSFATAGAQTRSLTVERFHSTLTLTSSGTLHVAEEVTFRFVGSWNGIYRNIPVIYEDPLGFDYRLRVGIESVTLADGTELRTERSVGGGHLKVKAWVPGATDATRTVVIRYSVPNALRFFEEHDELYWNVTGVDWDVPLGPATATLMLPNGITGLRTTAYTGAYGSRSSEAEVTASPSVVEFATREPLGFRNGLTIVVGWDPGVVDRPSTLDKAVAFIRANFLLLLPLLSLFLMWKQWEKKGRDPEVRSVHPRYEPAEGLSPGEAGTLVDNSPDVRDITATIVDLAIRGYLRIEEEEQGAIAKFFGRKEFAFVRTREVMDWQELLPHERDVLVALFDGGTRTTSDDLENEFYKKLPGIKSALFRSLVAKKFYQKRPDKVVARWVGAGVATCAIAPVFLNFLALRLAISPLTATVAGILFGIPVIVFGALMGARTSRGVRKLEEILGFEEFLARVEKDRFRRMIETVEQFEAILPHAMALGVEKKWAEAFDDLYSEPPDWYRGRYHGGFRPSLLTAHLADFSSRTGSAMTSAPRSSSGSSGFGGGGGFSGGGFGGGGGGGF